MNQMERVDECQATLWINIISELGIEEEKRFQLHSSILVYLIIMSLQIEKN